MTKVKSIQSLALPASERLAAGMVCLLLGSFMVFAVGLSNMSLAHNTAHDTRHAIGFPCH
jgi:cobalt transporter subunit CbtB